MPRGTWVPGRSQFVFVYGAITPYGGLFQKPSTNKLICNSYTPGPTTPARFASRRFRLFPFRSPLLRESLLLSFPPGTEMVHFPGLPLLSLLYSGENVMRSA